MFIIYRALNLRTLRSYIGQTKRTLEQRMYSHTTQAALTKFSIALASSSQDDWEWSVLASVETVEEAQELEARFIWEYRAITQGYNSPIGVSLYSPEARKKMSLAAVGRVPWNAGRKGVYSEESLERMALAKLGRSVKHTPEWNENKRKATQEAQGRKVQCLNSGVIYPSVGECARALGVAKSTVNRVLSGRSTSKTIKVHYI